jgi:hypothetical protein
MFQASSCVHFSGLSASPVTTARHVLRSRMEEMVSRYGGQLWIYRISSRGQPTGAGPPAWGLGGGLTTPHHKTPHLLCNILKILRAGWILWQNDQSTKKWIWDLALGMLGASYRTGSLMTVARELGKCKLDLAGVQVRWEKGGTDFWLGITNVDFGVIDQRLIKFSISSRYWRKSGSIMVVHQLFTDTQEISWAN